MLKQPAINYAYENNIEKRKKETWVDTPGAKRGPALFPATASSSARNGVQPRLYLSTLSTLSLLLSERMLRIFFFFPRVLARG